MAKSVQTVTELTTIQNTGTLVDLTAVSFKTRHALQVAAQQVLGGVNIAEAGKSSSLLSSVLTKAIANESNW